MYLESCLVCNPVTVSESRSGRMMISGHIMDGSTRKKDEVHRNNLVTYNLQLVPQRRQIWSKRRFFAEKWFRPETNTLKWIINTLFVCVKQISSACSRPFTFLSQTGSGHTAAPHRYL